MSSFTHFFRKNLYSQSFMFFPSLGNCLLFTVYYFCFTVYCLCFIVYCLWCTVYSLLFTFYLKKKLQLSFYCLLFFFCLLIGVSKYCYFCNFLYHCYCPHTSRGSVQWSCQCVIFYTGIPTNSQTNCWLDWKNCSGPIQ